nr:immunoglobulin light chain junction region [Macaca mulatta]
CQHYNSLPLTV